MKECVVWCVSVVWCGVCVVCEKVSVVCVRESVVRVWVFEKVCV